MRRSENSDARAVMADLDRLEHDHRRCETCHALVKNDDPSLVRP
jgi:hypothetical protein